MNSASNSSNCANIDGAVAIANEFEDAGGRGVGRESGVDAFRVREADAVGFGFATVGAARPPLRIRDADVDGCSRGACAAILVANSSSKSS